jgi:simple sugar transport system permease protein
MIGQLTQLIIATLVAGTPLVYAALGELVVELAGVLNMGVEGMMVIGAISAFAVTMATGSLTLGVIVAIAAAMVLSLLFAVLAISFRANQVAVGLALTIFGTSLGSYIGKSYVGMALVTAPSPLAGLIIKIPLLGQLHPLVWLSWILFGATWYFLYRTKPGLVLRAVGESPASAHAIGYPVIRIRYLATLFGGALAGVAGAYVSLVYTALWTEGLPAEAGSPSHWSFLPPGGRKGASPAHICSAARQWRSSSLRARAWACRRNSCPRSPTSRPSLCSP